MKQYIKLIALFSLLLPCVACATPVTVKVKVIDEQQQPVANADIRMTFFLGKGVNSYSGATNIEGTDKATENADFGVSVSALKEGYYRSNIRTSYGDQDVDLVVTGKEKSDCNVCEKNTCSTCCF